MGRRPADEASGGADLFTGWKGLMAYLHNHNGARRSIKRQDNKKARRSWTAGE